MSTLEDLPTDLSQSYSSDSLQPASSTSPGSTSSNHQHTQTTNSPISHHNSNRDTSNTVILYKPPTPFTLLRSAAINLILPFINGLMLGFGELFAHEIAFRLGWSGTRIFPTGRTRSNITSPRPVGPGIEVREDPSEAQKRELADLTSME